MHVIRFEQLIGSGSYDGKSFYTLGINYVFPCNHWLDIESGLEYSEHTILITPAPTGTPVFQHQENFSLLNIPVTARLNFLKYFFINGGVMIDIDASTSSPIDSQTGLGGMLGIAAKYNFKFGMSVFVNPYTKSHALIPFSSGKYPQRLMETGIRFGIEYQLGEKK